MKYLFQIALLVTVAGCLGSGPHALAPIPSPNQSLIVTPSVNRSQSNPTKYLCIAFDITDVAGGRLHHVQTSASDRMKWALGWYDDATVVLYSSDIGTYAWRLTENGTIVEMTHPLPAEVAACGDRLKAGKYER